MEIISFAVTIAVGVISIVLGGFAIWISLKFQEQSATALAAVERVVGELRSITSANLDHQKVFSSKMLDSILAGPYGERQLVSGETAGGNLEALVKDELKETESRIIESVRGVLAQSRTGQSLTPEIEAQLALIVEQIEGLSTRAAETAASSVDLPHHVGEALERWRSHPAHYSLIWAVIAEGGLNALALEKEAARYGILLPAHTGINNLLENDVLVDDDGVFRIEESSGPALAAWVDRNRDLLERLKEKEAAWVEGGWDQGEDHDVFEIKMRDGDAQNWRRV